MKELKDKSDWRYTFVKVSPTGSRHICSPPVMDTDEDFVCLTYFFSKSSDHLRSLGFLDEGDFNSYPFGDFVSWRKGATNLIVTQDASFYDRFVDATRLAKYLNLTNKSDRIDLFQHVLYEE